MCIICYLTIGPHAATHIYDLINASVIALSLLYFAYAYIYKGFNFSKVDDVFNFK